MKYILTFAAGAVAGAIGMYLYFSNKIDTIVKNTVTEEMDKFISRQEQMKETETAVPDSIEPEEKVSDVPDTTEKSSIIEMERIITNYRNINNEEDDDDDDDDDDEDYITDEEMEELMNISRQRMSEAPHLVTEEERDTLRGYDHVEYTWYPEGDILTDILDKEVEEPEAIFGSFDWRAALINKSEITVRVPSEATDYTIYNDNLYVNK